MKEPRIKRDNYRNLNELVSLESCLQSLASEVIAQAGRDAIDFHLADLYSEAGIPLPWPLDDDGVPVMVAKQRDPNAHRDVRHFFLGGACQRWLDLAGIELDAEVLWDNLLKIEARPEQREPVAVDESKMPVRHLSLIMACDNFLETRGMNWTPRWLKDRWSKKNV